MASGKNHTTLSEVLSEVMPVQGSNPTETSPQQTTPLSQGMTQLMSWLPSKIIGIYFQPGSLPKLASFQDEKLSTAMGQLSLSTASLNSQRRCVLKRF